MSRSSHYGLEKTVIRATPAIKASRWTRAVALGALGLFGTALTARAIDTNVTVQNQTYASGANTQVLAMVQVSANTSVNVSSGATVTYMAGSRIVLGVGFRAQTGASFHAVVDVAALQNPTLDTDGDGIPDAVEGLLGTNRSAGGTTDASNSMHVNVNKPAPDTANPNHAPQ